METTMNLKTFVDEVHQRPVLWDIEYETYKDRVEKKLAWEEVCRIFYPEYDEKTISEKSGLCFTLTTKWKNLRDNYQRAVKKSANKTHIHTKLLHFLDDYEEKKQRLQDTAELEDVSPTRAKRKRSEDTVMIREEQHQEDIPVDIKTEILPMDNLNESVYDNIHTNNNTFCSIPTNQQQPHEDDDLSFFSSTLPMVRTLTPRQKLSFRIDVMNVLQKYLS